MTEEIVEMEQLSDDPVVTLEQEPGLSVEDGTKVSMTRLTPEMVEQATTAGKRVRGVAEINETAGGIPVLEAEEALRRTEIGRVVDPARTPERNFSLDYIDTADDIKQWIDDTSLHLAPANEGPRGGVRSHEETTTAALDGGPSLEDMLRRKPDRALNAEQLVRARFMMVQAAEEIHEQAKRIMNYDAQTGVAKMRSDVSVQEQFQFRKRLATYAALQNQVQGAVKEAGRALNAMKIHVGNDQLADLSIGEKFDMMGGSKTTEGLARLVLDSGGDPTQIANIARKGWFRRAGSAVLELWINGLLSGPSTHTLNTAGNYTTATLGVAERYFAAGVGKLLRTPDGVEFREANAAFHGFLQGHIDGFLAFGRSLRRSEDASGGRALIDPGHVKTEFQHTPAFTAENLGVNEQGLLGQSIDLLGKWYVRVPGRMLEAEDEFFKAIGYSMELHAQAYRRAADEFPVGSPEFQEAMGRILNDPPEEIAATAVNFARYQTFTNDLTDRVSKRVQELSNVGPLKLFLPFVRTPTNIMKYGLARLPTGVLMPSVMSDLAAGGARRDMAVGRMALGSMVAGVGYMLTANYEEVDGKVYHRPLITGAGPKSLSMRKVWESEGIKPYSIYLDGKYVEYDRFEPFGIQLALTATAMEVINNTYDPRRRDEQIAAVVMGLSDYMLDKSYMQGFSDLLDLLRGKKNLENWSAGMAASFVPAWLRRTRYADDELKRETKAGTWLETYLNKVTNMTPGWVPWTEGSKSLPARVDVWGNPMRYGDPLLHSHIYSPFVMHAAKNNPLTLHLIENKVPLKKPDGIITTRSEGLDGEPVEYEIDILQVDTSGRAYAAFLKMVGKRREARVRAVVQTHAYMDAPQASATRRQIISREMDRGRDDAIEDFKAKYSDKIKRQMTLQDMQRQHGFKPTLPPHATGFSEVNF